MNSDRQRLMRRLQKHFSLGRLWVLASGAPIGLAALVPVPANAAGALPTPCSATASCANAQGLRIQQFTTDGVVTSGGNPSARFNIVGNLGTVQQYANKAIVNWRNFDIGTQNEVRYVRVDDNGNPIAGANFSTLNRIYQGNPSVIEGKISVEPGQNGQIYLINQNGILFKGTAQVDVNTLVASALNIKDENFLSDNGIFNAGIRDGNTNPIDPAFYWEGDNIDAYNKTFIQVEPNAKLAAQLGGAILLLGPNVTNRGTIATNEGQVVLAAGAKVYITAPDPLLGRTNADGTPVLSADSPYRGLAGILVEVDPFQYQSGSGDTAKTIDSIGRVFNDTMGNIIAAKGNATLVGLTINQMGRISATTSVSHKGSIRLLARQGGASLASTTELDENNQKVGGVNILSATNTGNLTLGADSVTEVTPAPQEGSSAATLTDDQLFNPSTIQGIGKNVYLEDRAIVYAPGGYISLSAQAVGNQFQLPAFATKNNSRIYQSAGSVIDVSGASGAQALIERYFRSIDLRAAELKDNPLNRNALLRGQTIQVDLRDLPDASLADLSSLLNTIPRTVTEKLAAGGGVRLRSEGDIVLRAGSKIDISGNSVDILGGFGSTSRLVSNGLVFDIAQAKGDRVYQAIINDKLVVTDPKWGVQQSYNLLSNRRYYQAYKEGTPAGSLALLAHAYALDGDVVATVLQGVNQRQTPPTRGALSIGNSTQNIVNNLAPSLTILNAFDPLDDAFDKETSLPQARVDTALLSSAMLNRSGLGKVTAYSNGKIIVESNSALALPAFGELSLTGSQIEVRDNIAIASGKIGLSSLNSLGPSLDANSQVDTKALATDQQHNILIKPGVTLSTAGQWVNDRLVGADLTLPLSDGKKSLWDGGSVSLSAYDGISLGDASAIDVGGSGYVNTAGKFTSGNAGAISLATNKGKEAFTTLATLDLPADLRAALRAQAPGKGGSLSLKVGALTIGTRARGAPAEFLLTPDFFSANAFASYNLEGRDSVTLSEGTNVNPTVASLRVDASFTGRASGSAIGQFSSYEVLPAYRRQAVALTLQARNDVAAFAKSIPDPNDSNKLISPPSGVLNIGQNAQINLDPGGSVFLGASGSLLEVEGKISAPAGNITLAINRNKDATLADLGYDSTQAIWIGSSAQLSATGAFVATPTNNGLRKGKVLDAGNISIDAQNGYVVAQTGAVLDVSAVAATLDVPLQVSPFLQATRIAGNAGTISVGAREGALLDATLIGSSAGALGGNLILTLDRKTGSPELGYPGSTNYQGKNDTARQWKIELTQDYTLPGGLKPGVDLNKFADVGGTAPAAKLFFGINRALDGGFEQLTFNAEHALTFKGDVTTLAAANSLRAITLNTPVIESAGGIANLSANNLNLGNQSTDISRQQAQTASYGNGVLEVAAQHVDLTGHFALQGFHRADIASDGDLRLVGVAVAPANNNTAPTRPEGSFAVQGDLTLQASQVYATTFSDYRLNVTVGSDGKGNAGGGTVSFLPGARAPSPVLSAASDVTVNATSIAFAGGVLKAPLGSVTLSADEISLGAGSLIAVSTEDRLIPFGLTSATGKVYDYKLLGGNIEIATAPQKNIVLKGRNVTFDAGATLDVAGGGDLLAYEFIPGIGGSRDVLSPSVSPNTYAILPNYNNGKAAPYDSQIVAELNAANVAAPTYGQSVYLNAAGNLPAGYYTLLPARYALLPGAYLVSSAGAKYQDLPSTQSIGQIPGGTIVAGNFAALNRDGTYTQTSRSNGFLVEPGTLALTRSEYLQTLGSKFFSGQDVPLPGDAGRVVFEASKSLKIEGQLAAQHAAATRGAAVDISALKLALVSPGGTALDAADADAVRLDANALSNLGAESIFLGGSRSYRPQSTDSNGVAQGVDLKVVAQKVIVANDAQHDFTAPEIVLAAIQQVQVKSGSSITATGTAARADDINVTNVDGNGALLRVANTPQVTVSRQTADRTQGEISIAANTTLSANGAINLDATKNTSFSGELNLGPGAGLAIAAGSIGVGDVQGLTQGTNFDQTAFAALLAKTGDLRLTSYSSIDFYGTVDAQALLAGNAAPDLSLRATGLVGFAGANGARAEVSLSGNRVTLSNSTVTASSPDGSSALTPVSGNGKLTIKAQELRTGDGNFALSGFAEANLQASSQIVAAGKGALNTPARLTLDAPRVTAEAGANYAFKASNTLAIASSAGQAAALAHNVPSAHLNFEGTQVNIAGLIDLPGGKIDVTATQGDLNLNKGAVLRAAGREEFIFDAAADQPGGFVALSAQGKANLNAGSLVDVSSTGADAGTLSVSASALNLQGDVQGAATVGAEGAIGSQGRFVAQLATLAALDELADKLSAGGFTDSVRVTVANGDTNLASGKTLTAREIQIANDGGSISIAGTLNANHARGGSISLAAKNDVTLLSGAILQVEASDSDRQGGLVEISAKDGYLDLQSGTSIKVVGGVNSLAQQFDYYKTLNNGRLGGQVWLRTGVDSNYAPKVRTDAQGNFNLKADITGADYLDASTIGNLIVANPISATPSKKSATYLEAVQQLTFNVDALTINAAKDKKIDLTKQVQISTLQTNLKTFYDGVVASLVNQPITSFRIVPGLEISNTGGGITLANNWNLGSAGAVSNLGSKIPAVRYGANNEAGVLTLRAAGNITFNASLSDGFRDTSTSSNFVAPSSWAYDTSLGDTWSYRIVAGSNFDAAAPLAVKNVNANVVVSAGIAAGVAAGSTSTSASARALTDQLIRTGAGFVDVAAGQNIVFNKLTSSGSNPSTYVGELYTAGRLSPAVDGFSSNSKTQQYYPNAGGDIRLTALGDINGQPFGGANAQSEPVINEWLFRDYTTNQTNPRTTWFSRFDKFRQGVATLGGGDINVEAKNIDSLWLSAPTNARLGGDATQAANIDNLVVQGGGDITVRASGSVKNGLIFLGQGQGKVVASGSLETQVALQDATAKLTAINDVTVIDAFNPTNISSRLFTNVNFSSYGDIAVSHNHYDAALQVVSRAGNVQLNDTAANVNYDYPGLLSAVAPQGNVTVGGTRELVLFPHASGNLDLIAGGDVLFDRVLVISDYAVTDFPSIIAPLLGAAPDLILSKDLPIGHDQQLLHKNDTRLARVYAVNDINVSASAVTDVAQITLAKPGVVQAGRDILNLGVDFQNLKANDVSQLFAGRDIRYDTNISTAGVVTILPEHIAISGPGRLEVAAGRNIDLGASAGIVSVGNSVNPYLSEQGANLTVLAGFGTQGNSVRMPDYAAFAAKYLMPDSMGNSSKELLDYMAYLSGIARKEVQAELEAQFQLNHQDSSQVASLLDTVYKTQVDARQQSLLAAYRMMKPSDQARSVYFNILRQVGFKLDRAQSTDQNVLKSLAMELGLNPDSFTIAQLIARSEAQGRAATAVLLPTATADGQNLTYSGDLNLFFSQIKTAYGGDIELFVPGGLLNVGLASAGGLSKTPAELGIVAVGKGDVNAFVRDDILVNQSRIFTLGGGDIVLWSDHGNIDAGKGSKTVSSVPPPRLVVKDGKVTFDTSGSITGSGIGTLVSRQDAKKGDVVLVAPDGIIDPGDAGIQSAGNFPIPPNIKSLDNVKVDGKSVAPPPAAVAGAGTGVNTGDTANATDQQTKSLLAGAGDKALQQDLSKFRPSFISVEVLGFGPQGQAIQ